MQKLPESNTQDNYEVRLSLDFGKNSDRIERAAVIDYANAHHWYGDHYEVESFSDREKRYVVTPAGTCTCPDYQYRKVACQHILASLAAPVVWAVKWVRASRSADEAFLQYRAHLDTCRQQNMAPQYVALLDIEYNRRLSELAATSTEGRAN